MTSNSTPPSCRVCEGLTLDFQYEVKACKIVKCNLCGLTQVSGSPAAEDLHSLYGESYFNRGKYVEDKAQDREQARRLKLLQSCGIPRNARILDGGCATGGFIKAASNYYEMWGIDISPYAISQAKLDNPKCADRISAGLIEDQNFPNNHFDAIVFWDVIEHLDQPVEVIRNLIKFLKPQGYFILSTPNISAPIAKLMGKRWAFMTPPEHLCLFNSETIRLLMSKAGLDVKIWMSKGKWVNLGFFLYKLNKVFPGLLPANLIDLIRNSRVSSQLFYVPTGDIQYVASRLDERLV